jgi:DNA-binding transcriptional LysR family regulator
MDAEALELFVEASAARSLAAAARRLRLQPMAASRRLAALENELGARLFHRTTRALHLTREGEALLPHARAVVEAAAAARASVRASGAGVAGLLRVTSSDAFGRIVLVPVIADLLAQHPDLQIDLTTTDRVVDIVGEGLDLAIRLANLRDSSVIARRVADNRRSLYAAPDYLARHGAPARLADLAAHQCLAGTGTTHWPFVAGRVARSVAVAGRFSASSVESLHAACCAGLGLALLSDWVVAHDLAAGRLQPVPLADATPEPLAIWAVYPSRRLLPPKVGVFIEALQRQLA